MFSFDRTLAKLASLGEATYRYKYEEATQIPIDVEADIGGSIGVGGGMKVGFSADILSSHSYPLSEGYLLNGENLTTKVYTSQQSPYRGAGGIEKYIFEMLKNTLSSVGDRIKSLISKIGEKISDTGETIINWVEGKTRWIWKGKTKWLSTRQTELEAELVGYEVKAPVLTKTRGEFAISFIPYKSTSVKTLSRQPAQEVTIMTYGVNLNVKQADGTYLSSFPAGSNTLEITIDDNQLSERGFDPATDWQSLNIFWFNPDDNTWYQLPTTRTRNADSTTLQANPEKPGTYAGGIASLPPDREPPQITIISPQDGAKTSLTPIFSATIVDPNLKVDSIKFILDGNEVQPIYTYADPSQNQYLALPSQPLSQGSHTLRVVAEDKSGNHSEANISFNASSPRPQDIISFVSLPFVPTESLSHLLDFQQAAIWNGIQYVISNDLTPQMAQGFWLKTSQTFEPSVVKPFGYAMRTDEEISLPLSKGWQAFGLPWTYPLPISALQIEDKNGKRMSFSDAGNIIGLILFRYDGQQYQSVSNIAGMENTLYPWFGYWIMVKDDCKLIFPNEPWNAKAKRASNLDGFCLPIKAVFSDGTNEEIYIGMGKQEITSPFPPPAPYSQNQKRLSIIKNGELLYIDIRKEGGKQEWRLAVKGDATLFFPNLSYLPKGWQAILTDGDKRYYLKTTSAIKVEGDKELKVEIGEGLITPLLINMVEARSVREGVNISWNVNLPCQVKVAIKGADGRVLRDLGMGTSSSGLNSIFWDGRGQDGRNLPAGIYIIELTARDELNQMIKAIRMVNLR